MIWRLLQYGISNLLEYAIIGRFREAVGKGSLNLTQFIVKLYINSWRSISSQRLQRMWLIRQLWISNEYTHSEKAILSIGVTFQLVKNEMALCLRCSMANGYEGYYLLNKGGWEISSPSLHPGQIISIDPPFTPLYHPPSDLVHSFRNELPLPEMRLRFMNINYYGRNPNQKGVCINQTRISSGTHSRSSWIHQNTNNSR